MHYRRLKIPGASYFFTVVTNERRHIFHDQKNILYLRKAIHYTQQNYPFIIEAFVLLPDHLHCIWTLPAGDHEFSTRWRLIKSYVTRYANCNYPIWQKRYWEHVIRNDNDFEQHVNYIHYNPVKHGLVQSPKDWLYSSFPLFVKRGIYNINWGISTQDIPDEATGHE